MKILILGAGGIGSFFVEELCNCIEQEQISPHTDIFVADDDIVELNQLKYQNFELDDIGKNKAQALTKRYKFYGVQPIPKRITRVMDLKPYDFIVSCVDNEKARMMVINHCFIHHKEFLDLRSQGRRVSAFPKLSRREDNLAFIDQADIGSYSCQDKETLKKGLIDKGNKIVALIGVQMLLNYTRNKNNIPTNIVI